MRKPSIAHLECCLLSLQYSWIHLFSLPDNDSTLSQILLLYGARSFLNRVLPQPRNYTKFLEQEVEKVPEIPWNGGWKDYRGSLESAEEKKRLLLPGIETWSPSHYVTLLDTGVAFLGNLSTNKARAVSYIPWTCSDKTITIIIPAKASGCHIYHQV